jgi:hypothetical protein
MDQIKKIVNRCIDKLDNIPKNTPLIRETYYHIYLTSQGVRNGTYLEITSFNSDIYKNEKEYVKYLEETFKELKEIKNIDFYVGKLYDNSRFRDTVYVYYKPRKTKLFKIIKLVEDFDRNKIRQETIKEENKLHSNIAKLLSYEIVNYNKTDDFITINFKLSNDGFIIDGYYITKNQLQKAYDKMIKINKALKLINEWCYLAILNESY